MVLLATEAVWPVTNKGISNPLTGKCPAHSPDGISNTFLLTERTRFGRKGFQTEAQHLGQDRGFPYYLKTDGLSSQDNGPGVPDTLDRTPIFQPVR